MSNVEKGEVSVEIDGTSYRLGLNLNVLCEIEEMFGTEDKPVSFQEVLKKVEAGSLRHVRGVFLAMLHHCDPSITLHQAGALLDTLGASEIGKQFAALKRHAQADPRDVKTLGMDKPARPQKPRRQSRAAAAGIGTSSTGTRGGTRS